MAALFQNTPELISRLTAAAEELSAFRNLILVKAHVGRPKDKTVEVELRAIRERLAQSR